MTLQRVTLALPGNEAFAARLAHALGSTLARLESRHFPDGESYVRLHGDRRVEIDVPDLAAWRYRTPVWVDDIASSGRTLAQAARAMAAQGLPRPECVVVHALFAGDAWAKLTPLLTRITSTDAVAHPSNRIALAPLIASALLQRQTDHDNPRTTTP